MCIAMPVYQPTIDVAALANHIKARTMSKRVKTANCTHVDMDRSYGWSQECYLCGKNPCHGFLYACRQDSTREHLKTKLLKGKKDKIDSSKSDLHIELEKMGFSESIILTAEQGHYTDAQLSKLKELKLELKQVIKDVQQSKDITDAVEKLAVIEQISSSTDGTSQSSPKKTKSSSKSSSKCTFKACHQCRPYFRDRLYISIGAVIYAEFPPLTYADTLRLPMKSPSIMRTIGLTAQTTTTPSTLPTSTSLGTSWESPKSTSTELTSATQSDSENTSSTQRPRKRFQLKRRHSSREDDRDSVRSPFLTRRSFKSAVHGIFRQLRRSNSNTSLPLRTPDRIQSLNKSEPVLQGVHNQTDELNTPSKMDPAERHDSHSPSHAQAPPDPLPKKFTSVAKNRSTPPSTPSLIPSAPGGSEVKVSGGLALTEEAVETQTPDIIAFDVPVDMKIDAVVRSQELNGAQDQDDVEADIGLQNIMAQV